MLNELTEYYQPQKILHREKQIKQIKDVFKNFKENGLAQNLIIMGVTGSGKTTSVKKVIEEENNSFFGTGAITKTTFKLIKSMFDLNCSTSENLLKESISLLRKDPKVLIIDELNKIEDIVNFFNCLNVVYRETGCPIILITNKRTIFEEMPEDARLTLILERVDFPAYNSLELYDILKERLSLIKDKIPNIEESALRKISAIGGKESSARLVLNITLKCILSNDFSDKRIDEIKMSLEKDDWRDFIFGLRPIEKEFLKNLLDLQTIKKEVTPSDLSASMEKKFTPPRISQLISSFENYGIIKSQYLNLGRAGGRKRILKFASQYIFENLSELIE